MRTSCKQAIAWTAIAILLCSLAIFSCLHKFENPNDPAFDGDYVINATWDSVAVPETLEVLRTYAIPFTQGKDEYDSLSVNAPVNLTLLNDSYATGSALSLRFNAAFSGSLRIAGIRPNGKIDSSDAVTIVVKNPYRISGGKNYGTGEIAQMSVFHADSIPVPANWRIVWNAKDTLMPGQVLAEPVELTHEVTAAIIDEYGVVCPLAPVTVTAAGLKPTLTATLGDTIRQGDILQVQVTTTGTVGGKFRLIFRAGDAVLSDTTAEYGFGQRSIGCIRPVTDTGEITFTAVAVDATSKLASDEVSAMRWVGYLIPRAHFIDSAREVPTNRPFTVSVVANGATGFRWTSIGLDTTTTTTEIVLRIPTENAETLFVRGVNQWGLWGPADTLVIHARAFAYDLKVLAAPTEITARHVATFAVQAVLDSSTAGNAVYHWVVARPPDSTSTNARGDTLRLRYDDSTAVPVAIRVFGTIGADSTPVYTLPVTIRRYAPRIAFRQSEYQTGINERVTMIVDTSDYSGTVVEIFYRSRKAGSASWKAERSIGRSTTIADTFADTGAYEVEVRCIDNDGFYSARDTALILVTAGKPYFTGTTSLDTSTFINDPLTLRVAATPGATDATVTRYVWRIGMATLQDSSITTLTTTFANPGTEIITVCAYNSLGDSTTLGATITVFVSSGRPVVVSVAVDTPETQIFVADPRRYRVSATDSNGTVKKLLASWDGDAIAEDSLTVSATTVTDGFTHSWTVAQSGARSPRFWAWDDDGYVSPPFVKNLTVRLGRPRMISITKDSATVWIRDLVRYTVSASDTNSVSLTTTSYFSFDNGTTFRSYAGLSADTAFADSGTRQVKAYVVDNDSIPSDTISLSVQVLLGKPSVTSITPDAIVYINDPRQFAIATYDPNGMVDSVSIDNGSGTFGLFVKTTNGAYTFNRTFTRGEAGPKTIRVIAKDNDGVLSDTSSLGFIVRLGAPVLDSLRPLSTWINDDSAYHIYAHDTNGTVTIHYFDFDNNGVWDDSSAGGTKLLHFASAGVKTVRTGVADNDTIVTTATQTVTVHLGMPRVWNPGGDTLFVATPAGGGNINIPVSSYDTNGTIQKYYWKFNQPFDTVGANQTATDSIYPNYNIAAPLVNNAFRMATFGNDDDGNVAADTFWLYPDGPPLVPDTVSPSKNANLSGTVKFIWQNVDQHDQAATQYQVLCDDSATPVAVLGSYQPGTAYTSEGTNRFSFSRSLTGAGVKFWRVVAKDARGSITEGPISWFIYNP